MAVKQYMVDAFTVAGFARPGAVHVVFETMVSGERVQVSGPAVLYAQAELNV